MNSRVSIAFIALLVLNCSSCINSFEIRHYNKDVNKTFNNEMNMQEFGKKYYYFYDKSLITSSEDSLTFLNKIFLDERENVLIKKNEFAGIIFFLNVDGRLVYRKSEYYQSIIDVKSFLIDKSRWSGYAMLEGNIIKTEALYNYNWSLAHQIVVYTYRETTLIRSVMYRYDTPEKFENYPLTYQLLR